MGLSEPLSLLFDKGRLRLREEMELRPCRVRAGWDSSTSVLNSVLRERDAQAYRDADSLRERLRQRDTERWRETRESERCRKRGGDRLRRATDGERAWQVGKLPPSPPTLGPPGGPEAWKMGGGRAATAVEKGGRMSATQAENKQTAVPLPGGNRRHVFLAWQSLRQGLCLQGGN